ncbi:CRAL-TRIO domain and GOLD domain-containing protein [Aphelenchoides besseyi]|nr:CRAL-TRIO domain and GOLD domain-containing protein [Aphelenchoides besseyi]KAI6210521.1 CRAL-TRIO domain and GOLD domain-containing protein [Aphelenchoides besseyi]
MTKWASTAFGEPLTVDSKKMVNEVRQRVTQAIHPNFDTDFNIFRFVLNAERGHKNRKDVIEHATKGLNQHLRLRKCLRLDEMPDIPFSDNPLFKRRYLPCGKIDEETDRANRLLWFIEYETISVEYIAHGMRSSEACRYQFWQFEHMLRRVNKQEEATGRLSSLRHIVDMNNYEINPFTMLFVSSGTLSYYSNLFHYENYPELVNPIEMVNIAKWIHMPYKLIKTMMPAGFTDRFRLHDGHFLPALQSEIDLEHIPVTLGGKNPEQKCTPAVKLPQSEYWTVPQPEIVKALHPLNISARKVKYFRIEVNEVPKTLSWYFTTDGDVYFGVFYEPHNQSKVTSGKYEKEEFDLDTKEMVYPWLKLTAKLVHEFDAIHCTRPGAYYVAFGNKHSWVMARHIDVMIQVTDDTQTSKCYTDGRLETLNNPAAHIVEQLKIQAHPTH